MESSILQRLTTNAKKNALPLRATIELTSLCNLKCVHCYFGPQRDAHNLSFDQVKDILKELRSLGTLIVTFTGGEVCLRDDLEELIALASSMNYRVDLMSNGTLFSSTLINCLKKHNVNCQLSLYGTSKETYELITRVAGSWDSFSKTINDLVQHNIRTVLSLILLHDNFHERKEMVKFAEERGMRLQRGWRTLPMRNGGTDVYRYAITYQEKLTLLAEVIDNPSSIDNTSYLEDSPCNAGITGINITPTGDITPCTGLAYSFGNINSNSLKDILASNIRSCWTSMKVKDMQPCNACDLLGYCSICPAMLQFMTTNEIKNKGTELCEEARILKSLETLAI